MMAELLEYWQGRPIPWEEVKYTDATKGLLSVAFVFKFAFRKLPASEQEKKKELYTQLLDYVNATVPRDLLNQDT